MEVIDHAKIELGYAYPDEKAIYAMEDVTEICKRLGRLSNGIYWLRQAFRAGLPLWGHKSSTWHIWEKLEALHEKRYQQATGAIAV